MDVIFSPILKKLILSLREKKAYFYSLGEKGVFGTMDHTRRIDLKDLGPTVLLCKGPTSSPTITYQFSGLLNSSLSL